MDLITKDIEYIREVRRLCIKHNFDKAIELAKKVDYQNTRNTLLFICRSFKTTQISQHVA